MDDIINKIKQGAEIVRDNAEKYANVAVSKTKNAIDKTKCNYTISGIETKVNNIYIALGEKLYAEYKNGAEFEGDVLDNCKQIDELKDEIAAIKSKMAEFDDSITCSVCGEKVPQGSSFCPKCGAKID